MEFLKSSRRNYMKSTTRFSKNKRGIECLNCKQPISYYDNFCSECGQVNDLQRVSIKQFISEFFSGFFSFDTRFFKTFVPLLFKPGKVTKEYVKGKRKKYVNPFQLYLNVTIVFFLLQGLFSAIDEYTISDVISSDSNLATSDSTVSSKTNNNNSLETYKQKLTFRIDSISNTPDFFNPFKSDTISKAVKDSIFDEFQKKNMTYVSKMINNDAHSDWIKFGILSTLNEFTVNYIQKVFKANNIVYNPSNNNQITFTDIQLDWFVGNDIADKMNTFKKYDLEHKDASASQAMSDLKYKKTRWNSFYFKTAQNMNKAKLDNEFLQSWTKRSVSKISIALFFLLPIFTLFLSLLYIRRKWNYTEHLVFVFNIQTVFFLLLIFFIIFDRIFKTNLGVGLFIPIFLFYLFKALHNFYGQHWFKTTFKFILLNCIYFILSIIGSVVVAFISFIL